MDQSKSKSRNGVKLTKMSTPLVKEHCPEPNTTQTLPTMAIENPEAEVWLLQPLVTCVIPWLLTECDCCLVTSVTFVSQPPIPFYPTALYPKPAESHQHTTIIGWFSVDNDNDENCSCFTPSVAHNSPSSYISATETHLPKTLWRTIAITLALWRESLVCNANPLTIFAIS